MSMRVSGDLGPWMSGHMAVIAWCRGCWQRSGHIHTLCPWTSHGIFDWKIGVSSRLIFLYLKGRATERRHRDVWAACCLSGFSCLFVFWRVDDV